MNKLKEHALEIRKKIIKMVYSAGAGHIGGAFSAVEIVTYLYFKEMNISIENLCSYDRDRFVLSKGHASTVLYGALMEKGLISADLMPTYRQVNSKLQGHPCSKSLNGVDISTGSLGQGFSASVGMALANKINEVDHRVFALLGDGECQEGIVWEAAMSAAHYKLDNLIAFLDFNGLQIDGTIYEIMNPTPLNEKFEAFGWRVLEIDGHSFKDIKKSLEIANLKVGKPTIIIAKTVKGKGVSFMENEVGWHGIAPNDEEFKKAMRELGEKI